MEGGWALAASSGGMCVLKTKGSFSFLTGLTLRRIFKNYGRHLSKAKINTVPILTTPKESMHTLGG